MLNLVSHMKLEEISYQSLAAALRLLPMRGLQQPGRGIFDFEVGIQKFKQVDLSFLGGRPPPPGPGQGLQLWSCSGVH